MPTGIAPIVWLAVHRKRNVRSLLIRLVPKRIRAWYRAMRPRHSRNNVILLLERGDNLARWLRATPDTYQVGQFTDGGRTQLFDLLAADQGLHPVLAHGPDEGLMRQAASALAETEYDFSVVGTTSSPPTTARGSFEPSVTPLAVAITRQMHEEIGGAPDGPDLVGLYLRARDAGARLALVRLGEQAELKPLRRDLIRAPAVLVFSAVPMHDVGGGSRGAQLARELVQSGCHVTYVSIFPSYEPVDLGLRFVHPRLEQYRLEEFEPAAFTDRARSGGWILLEIPAPEVISKLDELRSRGWSLCYDVIDKWSDPALGGDWYRSDLEARLLRTANLVVASAPDLVEDAQASGVDALLIPNAVDSDLFDRQHGPVPPDFPIGTGPVIGYHGSLYGDWIDWSGIEAVAVARPDSRVVMIGDVSKGYPDLPSNVSFLGLKEQSVLLNYISRFDVGLVPFAVSATTHAVSPLKVYEYLACGVPVAAPPLRALIGLDGVYTATSLPEAVEHALEAPSPDRDLVLTEHGWKTRVSDLMRGMGLTPPKPGGEPGVRRISRKVRHYLPDDRILD